MLRRIGYAVVFVERWEEAIRFYADLLGLELAERDDEGGFARLRFPGGGPDLMVEQAEKSGMDVRALVGTFVGLSVATDDIRAAYRQLAEKGVRFESLPARQNWGGWLAHFYDPDRNMWSLVEESGEPAATADCDARGESMAADDLTAQLVTELVVHDLDRSLDFYTGLGFRLERRAGPFAVLSWGGEHLLFLDEEPDLPAMRAMHANVRIIVPDVDARWEHARALGAEVARELADRPYGLRDFIVRDPDGFGLRFATPIRA